MLVILSAFSPAMKSRIDSILIERWNEYLRRVVVAPIALRAMLRLTRSVISGSSALHFLLDSPRSWSPGDCDIYVPNGAALRMIDHLRRTEGYVFCNSPEDASFYDPDEPNQSGDSAHYISTVNRLRRSDGIFVDVIESSSESSLHPLAAFWSTHLMNYVSADSLCVAYPTMTWNNSGCVASVINEKAVSAALKYAERGFGLSSFKFNLGPHVRSTYPSILDGCDNFPYCPHSYRHFGDKWCMQTVFAEDHSIGNAVDRLTPRWRFGGDLCEGCTTITTQSVELITQ